MPSDQTPLPSAAQAAAWKASTRDGDAVVTPFTYAEGFLLGEDTFPMPEAKAAWLNITLDGQLSDEARVRYIAPDCEDPACFHTVNTTARAVQLRIEDPTPGEWRILFLAKERFASPSYTTYRLEVNALVPGVPASGEAPPS